MRRSKKINKIKGFMLLFLIFLCFTMVGLSGLVGKTTANAASASLDIKTSVGFDGKIKEGRWFPATITLTNTADDVSGDLVLQMSSPSGGKDIQYVKHVDLPKGSTKEIRMTLPGISLNSDNNILKFYKGSYEKGTPLTFTNGTDYLETGLSRSFQIAVLARDPDTLNFLSLLNQKNHDLNVVRLQLTDIPEESMMLDGLDVIALNDFASDQLKEDQVKAITAWVERGGTLILAGGAGYPKTAKAFESIAPITYTSTSSLSQLPKLAKEAGKELVLTTPFTISNATLKQGEIVLSENELPLFAKRSVGNGEVLYAAYDLSLQPLASWNGSPAIWEKLLQNQLPMASLQNNGRPPFFLANNFFDLQYVLDFFPSLQPPSFFLLVIVFILYVVFVAPLLYLLLKRLDKREWAWVIIPIFSIVSSLGIYAIGASDKSSTLTHTLNTIELSGTGQAKRSSATAVFVPRGGEYELELPKTANIVAYNNNNYGPQQGGQLSGTSDQSVTFEPEATLLQWKGVPYWSIRKAWIQDSQSQALGLFEVSAFIDAQGLNGELVNKTKSDLTQVSVLFNQQVIHIGDLKIGEKKTFTLPTQTISTRGFMDYGQQAFPFPNGPNGMGANVPDDFNRERQMLNSYMNTKNYNNGVTINNPLVIGWSKDNQFSYKVNNKAVSSDQLNMWVQSINIQVTKGNNVSIPFGFVNPFILTNNLRQLNIQPDGNIIIDNGDFVFEYRLPQVKGATYTNLKIKTENPNGVPIAVQLWNEGKQAWDTIDSKTITTELTEHLEQVIIGGQTIRMKVATTQNTVFRYPLISLEGTVNAP